MTDWLVIDDACLVQGARMLLLILIFLLEYFLTDIVNKTN